MKERILIVEDEEVLRINLCEFLERHGYTARGVGDAENALAALIDEDYAIVITDIRLPGADGLALLKRVAAERPETFILVTTAYASVESVVEALRLGAFDYLLKPVVFEDLLQKVQNLIQYRALKEEVVRLRHDLHRRLGFEGIVGNNPVIKEVFALISKVASTKSTVLITGESGTGKELVARAIHAHSELCDRPFVAVNMAALPSEMVEAQLFGHEKGAFTGADRRRDGILRTASGGTVFLDEISELPMVAQAKLLRAIESHEVMPVGADRPVSADFRVIAATNRNLDDAVDKEQFRRDLFFRLNVFRVNLPALRDRRDDIPALVTHFAQMHSRALGQRPPAVVNEAMRLLLTYEWPGNVRELSNVIERATILAAGEPIAAEHLPAEFHGGGKLPMELKAAVAHFERRHVGWVLGVAGGNREHAARMLGIDPATLYRRLAKYELG